MEFSKRLGRCFVGVILLLLATYSLAFEINTHQAMTRCAISDKCNASGTIRSLNLLNFIEDAQLDESDYRYESFPGYGWTFLNYATRGEKAIRDYNIGFVNNGSYIDMIEAGVVLEDALWPGADSGETFGGDGRFNSHFYDPQQNGKKLSIGYGQREDAITWALDGATLGTDLFVGNRTNLYSLNEAFKYYRGSFLSASAFERKTAQAKLFVSLGHALHLLQDLHSTAHTRDDDHPLGDALEIFGRGDDGFHLRDGSKFGGQFKEEILVDTKLLPPRNYSTYRDFFTKEVEFVSEHFFSNDTYFNHPLPRIEDITFELIENQEVLPNVSGVAALPEAYYLNSTLVTPSKLGIRRGGFFYSIDDSMFSHQDLSVLQDNSRILMPRAIVSSEGFLNYFFRGRLEATVTADGDGIEIKNISDSGLVADAGLTTFNTGGTFDVYYQTNSGANKPLMSEQILGTLSPGETYIIEGLEAALQGATDIGDEGKIIVLFDGVIGSGIDERGLAVGYAAIIKEPIDGGILFHAPMGSPDSIWQTAILSIDETGSSIRQITNNLDFATADAEHSWSPDKNNIVFTNRGDDQIYIMNADGSNRQKITNIIYDSEHGSLEGPVWSPSGNKIAFTLNISPSASLIRGIYVMGAGGGNLKRLPATTATAGSHPSWSPLGNKIAYVKGGRVLMTIDSNEFTVPNSGSSIRSLIGDIEHSHVPGYAAWSPNGGSIAIIRRPGVHGSKMDLYTIAPDGSNLKNLTVDHDFPLRSILRFPTWSADGSKIAFVRTLSTHTTIYIMNADGTNLRAILEREDDMFGIRNLRWGR